MSNFLSASGAVRLMIKTETTKPLPSLQSGEERLCEAILLSAIDDYLHPICCGSNSKPSRLREQAREWFTRSTEGYQHDVFSFVTVCETLNLDYQAVWRRIQRIEQWSYEQALKPEADNG